jgi:hypothetical protein
VWPWVTPRKRKHWLKRLMALPSWLPNQPLCSARWVLPKQQSPAEPGFVVSKRWNCKCTLS